MLDRYITREGTLLFKGGEVFVDGWKASGPVMCRELVALACLYCAEQLMQRARALIREPGGDGLTCADMPSDTPREWLCEETRAFYEGTDCPDSTASTSEQP